MSAIPKHQTIAKEFIETRVGERMKRMYVKDILYFNSEEKVVVAYDGLGNEIILFTSLNYLEQFYKEESVRIHRRHILMKGTFDYVENIGTKQNARYQTHIGNKVFPVSCRRMKSVQEQTQCRIL